MFRCVITIATVAICCICVDIAPAQEIRSTSAAVASPVAGWYPWYEMHGDPENTRNVILCGTRWDAKDDAAYGFVYNSVDGGRTWHVALEDKSSTWVSEESCAFGTGGDAYFVAGASRVIDGQPHHDLGATHIYSSHNSGQSWKLSATTGWTDFSTSIVETAPGRNQNRLYVFFNNLQTFYNSVGNKEAMNTDAHNGNGTRVGMISYRDDDATVAGPFSSDQMAKEGYHGSYPAPAMMLKDGSIITIFTTKRRTEKNEREFLVYSARTNADRTSLEAPVKLVSSLDSPADDSGVACGGYYLGSGGAYDPVHDKLYFTYSDVRNKACRLFLTSSTDEGKSWSEPQQVRTPVADGEQEYGTPAIAVNKDGLLAILWQKKARLGCWMFATSADDGKSLSRATQLGTCSADTMKPSRLNTAYLWNSFFQADPKNPNDSARITLRNTRGAVWRNENAIAVTPDGSFHPVWSDPGNGEGELRTAAIYVKPAATLISSATLGLREVTNRVTVLYGDDQDYDARSKVLTLDVVIKNNSDQPLVGPFKLVVPNTNDGQFAEIANADNKVPGGGAVWDIGSSIPTGTLAPGASSKPFALKFRYLADEDKPRGSDDILGLSVKVFAAK